MWYANRNNWNISKMFSIRFQWKMRTTTTCSILIIFFFVKWTNESKNYFCCVNSMLRSIHINKVRRGISWSVREKENKNFVSKRPHWHHRVRKWGNIKSKRREISSIKYFREYVHLCSAQTNNRSIFCCEKNIIASIDRFERFRKPNLISSDRIKADTHTQRSWILIFAMHT